MFYELNQFWQSSAMDSCPALINPLNPSKLPLSVGARLTTFILTSQSSTSNSSLNTQNQSSYDTSLPNKSCFNHHDNSLNPPSAIHPNHPNPAPNPSTIVTTPSNPTTATSTTSTTTPNINSIHNITTQSIPSTSLSQISNSTPISATNQSLPSTTSTCLTTDFTPSTSLTISPPSTTSSHAAISIATSLNVASTTSSNLSSQTNSNTSANNNTTPSTTSVNISSSASSTPHANLSSCITSSTPETSSPFHVAASRHSDANTLGNSTASTIPSLLAPSILPSVSHSNLISSTSDSSIVNSKDAKRRKPKTNILKNNSSFLSRAAPSESYVKRISGRGFLGIMAFASCNRSLQWLDFSDGKTEQLTKLLFTRAQVTCHDVNHTTKSEQHLDVVMGFSSSDIMWYEPISQKYARINKNGIIHPFPVMDIAWIPNSEHLFIAAHADGSIVVYDKEKDDAAMTPETLESQSSRQRAYSDCCSNISSPFMNTPSSLPLSNNSSSLRNSGTRARARRLALRLKKSVSPPSQKNNPVLIWKISNSKIKAISFSPDARHLALVTEDGSLRLIDFLNETLLDVFHSFFGALLCVTWSPDGRYILTGGQDDLISIWSFTDRCLIARCEGHASWVTSIACDSNIHDGKVYRFASVGEDCKLLMWDFTAEAIEKKRIALLNKYSSSLTTPLNSNPTTSSVSTATLLSSSSIPDPVQSSNTDSVNYPESAHDLNSSSVPCKVDTELPDLPVPSTQPSEFSETDHPVEPRANIPVISPTVSKSDVDEHPISWVGFVERYLIICCQNGHIRTWNCPMEYI